MPDTETVAHINTMIEFRTLTKESFSCGGELIPKNIKPSRQDCNTFIAKKILRTVYVEKSNRTDRQKELY